MLTRRTFAAGGLSFISSIFSQTCLGHSATRHGCWLRAASDLETVIKDPRPSSGSADIDAYCGREAANLETLFKVRPALFFFDDGGQPNAFAMDTKADDTKPDGIVFIGIALANRLYHQQVNGEALLLAAVMAHEWGHIVQFRHKFSSEWGIYYELKADSGAGWYLASTRGSEQLRKHDEVVGQYFSRLGDTDFSNFETHGSPGQRSNEVLTSAGVAPCEGCGGYTPVPKDALHALGIKREE